jgi:hypothetical protein
MFSGTSFCADLRFQQTLRESQAGREGAFDAERRVDELAG